MRVAMCWPGGRKKAVTLSYDDGMIQDRRLIDIMDRNGLKGTFNLNGGNIPEEDAVDEGKMSRRQFLETFSDSGHEVAIHGYTHPSLAELSMPNIASEVLMDRLVLEKLFDRIIRGMAYPNGSVSDEVVEVLKTCGIAYSRTVVSTEQFTLPTDWLRLPATCHHNNPRLFELVEQFLNGKRRLVDKCWMFYLWGHSYEFDMDDNWDRIEKFAEMIGNCEELWYATNIEIYDYVEAYKALRYDVAGSQVYNPTQTDVWIHVNGGVKEIKAGTTVALPEFVDDLADIIKARSKKRKQ